MKPNKLEWVSYFSLMPILALILNLLLFGNRFWQDSQLWLYSYPLVFAHGFLAWYLHVLTMHWLRHQLPRIEQTLLRLILLALTHIVLTCVLFGSLFVAYDALHLFGYQMEPHRLQEPIILAVGLTMIATTLWESDYTYTQWKDSLAEKEKLQILTIQTEFETLKNQVNPHFLFNCFNTLSSLISEDRKQAENFLNELSKVYRYLLRNSTEGLSTLQEELRFIQSYYRLLQTRHGEGLQLQMEIDPRYEQYLVPSLSLQLLVENAVKHNVVSRQSPLVIDIFTAAGNVLVVNNNLQPKQSKVTSTRIGLENIRLKYALLNRPGIQILEDSKNFSVILPLVWSPTLANHVLTINEKTY